MKKSCKYSALVSAFADGELQGKKLEEFRAHLKKCAECRNELQEMKTVTEFLSGYRNEEVSESVYTRILSESGEVKKHLKTITLFHRISKISVAASIVLAFVAGILVSNKTFASNSDTTNIEFADNSFYEYLDLGE